MTLSCILYIAHSKNTLFRFFLCQVTILSQCPSWEDPASIVEQRKASVSKHCLWAKIWRLIDICKAIAAIRFYTCALCHSWCYCKLLGHRTVIHNVCKAVGASSTGLTPSALPSSESLAFLGPVCPCLIKFQKLLRQRAPHSVAK